MAGEANALAEKNGFRKTLSILRPSRIIAAQAGSLSTVLTVFSDEMET
jgi:hypothetical protein